VVVARAGGGSGGVGVHDAEQQECSRTAGTQEVQRDSRQRNLSGVARREALRIGLAGVEEGASGKRTTRMMERRPLQAAQRSGGGDVVSGVCRACSAKFWPARRASSQRSFSAEDRALGLAKP
jgi:hypothetical protein